MKKTKIIPGTKCLCGVVIAADGVDKFGNQKASFKCRLCGKRGSSVYGKMIQSKAKGKTTSCGCAKRSNFKNRHKRIVRNMHSNLRKQIFSDLHLTRDPFLVAEKYGCAKATVDEVRRQEYERLDKRFSTHSLSQFYAEINAGKSFMIRKLDLTVAESHALGVLYRQRMEATLEVSVGETEARETLESDAKFEVLAAWNALSEDEQVDAEEIVYNARWQMEAAILAAYDGGPGRYPRELTHAEFNLSKKYSYFRWVYESAVKIPEGLAHVLFGDIVSNFILLIRYTMRQREERKRSTLERIRDGHEPVRKVVEMAKRGVFWEPNKPAEQVIDMVITFGQYRIAG